MDKRLAKRHKRQVERARAKVKVSEPDVRTAEQIAADREATLGNSNIGGSAGGSGYSGGMKGHNAASTGSSARTAT